MAAANYAIHIPKNHMLNLSGKFSTSGIRMNEGHDRRILDQ